MPFAGPTSLLVIFAFVAFIIWHSSREKLEKRKLALEEQNRLLDRIGSGEELTKFLDSAQGQAMLERLDDAGARQEKVATAQMGVIGMLIGGSITSCIAIAFWVLAYMQHWNFMIPAVIVGFVGIGLFVAALIQYVLCKKWGLFDNGKENGRSDRRFG